MTFTYGDAEHTIAVALDLAELPAVIMAGFSKDAEKFLKGIQDDTVFGGGITPIALAEAAATRSPAGEVRCGSGL